MQFSLCPEERERLGKSLFYSPDLERGRARAPRLLCSLVILPKLGDRTVGLVPSLVCLPLEQCPPQIL